MGLLAAAVTKIYVFNYVTPCSLLYGYGYQLFRRTCYLHPEGSPRKGPGMDYHATGGSKILRTFVLVPSLLSNFVSHHPQQQNNDTVPPG
jgi:hypothetical protein